MSRLACHVNSWTAEAKHTVEACSTDLLVLNTAADVGTVRDWRARNPSRQLVYREVFEEGYPGEDVQGRCDRLCRHAEPLMPFGPIIALLPWNEERQADDLLASYAEDSCRAIGILRARGFLTAAGGFSVQWPRRSGRDLYLPAIREADFFHFHTYSAPSIFDDYERNVGHAVETAEWAYREAGRSTLITEFGIDWGVLGYKLTGWRGGNGAPSTPVDVYADQLRRAALAFPRCVEAIFVYCFGGRLYGWGSFDCAGEPVIESLLREEYPVYEFQMGFRELAKAMRARGLDPGEPTEPEAPHVFPDGWVVTRQRTTSGTMFWLKESNQPAFSGHDGRLTLYNGGQLITTVRGV